LLQTVPHDRFYARFIILCFHIVRDALCLGMAFQRKTIWITVILLIIAIVAVSLYRFYKSRFLDNTLPQTVNKESRGRYRISYDTIKIDELTGSLFVSNIKVNVDTASFTADSLPPGSPSVILNLHADSLTVTGIETPRALLKNEISGSKVYIKNVTLELFRLPGSGKKKSSKNDRDFVENIYYDVMDQLQLVNMDTIFLENVDLSYRDFKTKKLILRSKNLSLALLDLRIDTNSLKENDRIFFSKRVELAADSIQLRDPQSHYDFRFNGLQVNTALKQLKLSSVAIKPLLREAAFMKLFKTQQDRFDFSLNNITMSAIDPDALAMGELVADSFRVGQSSFKIYRDVRMARDKENRVGQYPHQVIMKVPFALNIRNAIFTNSYLEYKEMNEKTNKAGVVSFNRLTASMKNLTNQREAIRRNNVMTIDFGAWFLNIARADVTMKLRLDDKQGRFNVTGKLGAFDARKLNTITEPLGMARVEKGQIKSIVFNMFGDNLQAGGDLTMLYDDLKVSVLKLDDESRQFEKKGLTSALANALVKNKNPAGGNVRKASMANERNTNRSFFNLLWKSVFAGVKQTVGMDILGRKDPVKDKSERAREGSAPKKTTRDTKKRQR